MPLSLALVFATAKQGPGPATLAFRQSRNLAITHSFSRTKTTKSKPDRPRKQAHILSLTKSGNEVFQSHRRRNTSREKCHSFTGIASTLTHLSSKETGAVKTSSTSPPCPSSDVICLPPPLELANSERFIKDLNAAIIAFEPDRVLYAWSQIVVTQTTRTLSSSDYEAISQFLVKLIHQPKWSPMGLAIHQPEQFKLIRIMAIEAAVQDHWKGLQHFLLELIGVSRPVDVVEVFQSYKRRLREVLGKDVSKLSSRNREERVAARLSGTAPRVMTVIAVAALTMMNTFGSSDMLPLLDVSHKFLSTPNSEKRLIRHYLMKSSKFGDKSVVDRFYANFNKLQLAVQCYHPVAMESRIISLAEARHAYELDKLYDSLMAASIGPHRFIQPFDLHHWRIEIFDVIPLTASIWRRFLLAFGQFDNIDRINQMIDVDMPARGLHPTPRFLGLAMNVYSWTYTRHRHSNHDLAHQSMARCEALWQRLIDEGNYLTDEAISARIVQLTTLGRIREIEDLYSSVKNQFSQSERRGTDRTYLHLLLVERRWDEVFNIIKSTDSLRNSHLTYRSVIKHTVLRKDISYEIKRKIITRTMSMIPRWLMVDEMTLACVFSHFVRGGEVPIQKIAKTISRMMIKNRRSSSTLYWHQLILGLYQLGTRIGSEAVDLRAMVALLTEFNNQENLLGVTGTRLVNIWLLVLRRIALATSLTSTERHEMVEHVLHLFSVHMPIVNKLRWVIIQASFEREDDKGIAEALLQWSKMLHPGEGYKKPMPYWWIYMIEGLVNHGQRSLAMNFVRETIEIQDPKSMLPKFWVRAHSLGLLDQDEAQRLTQLPYGAGSARMDEDDDFEDEGEEDMIAEDIEDKEFLDQDEDDLDDVSNGEVR